MSSGVAAAFSLVLPGHLVLRGLRESSPRPAGWRPHHPGTLRSTGLEHPQSARSRRVCCAEVRGPVGMSLVAGAAAAEARVLATAASSAEEDRAAYWMQRSSAIAASRAAAACAAPPREPGQPGQPVGQHQQLRSLAASWSMGDAGASATQVRSAGCGVAYLVAGFCCGLAAERRRSHTTLQSKSLACRHMTPMAGAALDCAPRPPGPSVSAQHVRAPGRARAGRH